MDNVKIRPLQIVYDDFYFILMLCRKKLFRFRICIEKANYTPIKQKNLSVTRSMCMYVRTCVICVCMCLSAHNLNGFFDIGYVCLICGMCECVCVCVCMCVCAVYVYVCCLLYTSPSPRDRTRSRMPSSA